MDKNYVKSVAEGLKSSSSTRVQETLLKIRGKITVNDEGIKLFREVGGLDYLLPHLRKSNERILDITLSILGNCCLEEETSLAVGNLNAFGPLVAILKTVCRDSIVGRACRVMGNLAQRNSNAEGLHNHGAVAALVTFIESRDRNTSYPTLAMAVRAIRQLWMVTDKRDEMLSLNAVRCIAILLTTECESAGIIKSLNAAKDAEGFRKSQEEFISGVLKCLGYFTTHATAQCAEQLQGDGRGYQCLVALTKTYQSLTLKCLMNLCYISSSRPMLGTAGFVECLVGILEKISEVSLWPEGAARTLAHLSGEAVNRARLRHARGLPLLLGAARRSAHAMEALLQYVFDDTSFQILVSEGLINLLTDELTQYLTTMAFEHSIEADTPEEPTITLEAPSETDKCKQGSLLARRRSHHQSVSHESDEVEVVIKRDNMIVGFYELADSDGSDTQSEDEGETKRRGVKRPRPRSPKTGKKSQLIKMASSDWSAGVFWEPKSPELWTNSVPTTSRAPMSPERDNSPMSPYSDGNQSGFSPDYRKRARWDWSPESSSGFSTGEGSSASPGRWTEYQWSPASSPHSPFSANDESSDSEMSGRYSPVCSEGVEGAEGAEGAAADAAADADAATVANHLDVLVMDDDESLDSDATLEEDGNKTRIACVLVLLFRVSHGTSRSKYAATRDEPGPKPSLESLAGRECLNALLDYVERCKRPLGRAARILARVFSNSLCLMNILRHRLILRLHSMTTSSKHPPTKCPQCKQIVRLSSKLLAHLTILAESEYGIGNITYQLLMGNDSIKQTLCLTLPYIVKDLKHLKKYFVDCECLDMILAKVCNSQDEAQSCVVALSKLSTNIFIKDPKSLETRFKDQICIDYDPVLDNLSADNIVTFELDDESIVKANKVYLCQNSEVFSAMLMGGFKESSEECVRLKNVTKAGLEYLLSLLHFGLDNPNNDVEIFPLAEELETNLEVLLLSDRFLFEKLKALLSSAILQFKLLPSTAARIYKWSLSEGMGFLCVESVAYMLTGEMCDAERTQSLTSILEMEYKEQFLDDVKSLIFRHFNVNLKFAIMTSIPSYRRKEELARSEWRDLLDENKARPPL